MNGNILKNLVKNNIKFIIHLVDDIIKILATVLTLRLIIFIVSFFFSEHPPIIICMEIASCIGVLLIFSIYIASDVNELYKETFKSNQYENDKTLSKNYQSSKKITEHNSKSNSSESSENKGESFDVVGVTEKE